MEFTPDTIVQYYVADWRTGSGEWVDARIVKATTLTRIDPMSGYPYAAGEGYSIAVLDIDGNTRYLTDARKDDLRAR